MSIQTELTRLQSAKAAIKTAIEGKGVTVPDATLLDGMAALIDSIEAGGGAILGTITPATSGVIIIDLTEFGLENSPTSYPKARFFIESSGFSYDDVSHTGIRTLFVFDVCSTGSNVDKKDSHLMVTVYESSGSNSSTVKKTSVANMWNTSNINTNINGSYVHNAVGGSGTKLAFYAKDEATSKYGMIVGRTYVWGVIL